MQMVMADPFCRCYPRNRTMYLCPRQLLFCLFCIFATHNSVSKLSVYRWVIMSNLTLMSPRNRIIKTKLQIVD